MTPGLRLELNGISKQYPAVRANDRVDLRVKPGEIHAVLGENGAGKSTLMKIIYGAVQPDEGCIFWNGEPVSVASPAQARKLGISMVYQHFSLFDTLTAAENVWLGLDKSLTLPQVAARIVEVAHSYGLDVEPQRPVHSLSVGERQRVEIVRALLTEPQLLILDEPTSVLTPQAVDKLFVTLRLLAERGCSILYISHKLDEIRALCHHCTMLRGGKVTGEVDPTQETNASLSRLMIDADAAKARELKLAQDKTVADKARAEQLAADKPHADKPVQERKAQEDKARADKAAADKKLAEDKLKAEKQAADKRLADEKAKAEKLKSDKSAAEEKAKAEKLAEEKAKAKKLEEQKAKVALEGKAKTEVKADSNPVGGSQAWVVQAGSFGDKAKATELSGKLKGKGFRSQVGASWRAGETRS